MKHEYESPDIADLARQHGASWAGQLNEDELRKVKSMRIEVLDYAPRPKPRYVDARPLGWLGIVAIVSLFVAALVVVGRAW